MALTRKQVQAKIAFKIPKKTWSEAQGKGNGRKRERNTVDRVGYNFITYAPTAVASMVHMWYTAIKQVGKLAGFRPVFRA